MIKKHLAYEKTAYQIDIHGGGADLLFPHHENEVAQSRCGYDQELARYWVHNGFVTIDGEKMSKSLGNSFFVKDALNVYDGEILRFYLLCTHYRASLSYNDEDLSGSKKRLDRIYRLKKRLDGVEASQCDEGFSATFLEALQDDLNISVALATLDEHISKANDHLDAFPKDKAMKSVIMADLDFVEKILGVGGKTPLEYFQMGVSSSQKELIEEMIEKRSIAKKSKDFAQADALREELLTQGIALMDTPAGTQWEVVG
jgi:cysteinyl-tRNA synthetase